ncbi:flagellar filament capping protein FliD [Paenibacillus sp. LHD-38]|uniref:flagellar filament capping protein FliD n=1 Tax=Paenibacillus sp. LHD-38 TaxID=3072143 RepID=UPI00280C87AD|nr:flagellar filament capping protein FliD [Paenibacillus sp. LHD-38]MDQ8734018.1 flagellar filament capping protein FliD [Paenibacillus sp. LHD-38]
MINSIRMGGLVSGLDTETIVKNLMKAESAPLNKLLQKKQTEEWRRDQYREMNALLSDLKNKSFDMKLQGTYQKKVLTSDNDMIVSTKQKGVPSATSYQVDVQTLSVGAKPASVKFTTIGLADGSTAIGGAPFSFDIGTNPINVTATDTISSVIAKINNVSSTTGVTASYLKDDNSITLTTTASGANAAISINNLSDAANKLGLSNGTVNNLASSYTTSQLSADAIAGTVEINGIPYQVKSSTFTFDGVEFNIKGTGKTQVNLKPGEDAIFKSIKEYVDKYNEIIEKVNVKISESTYKDYKPLLPEEKETLSDKQNEQWEAKAKSGLLRQDTLLSNALSQMRQSLSTNVTGVGIDTKFDSLSEIGITTGSYIEKGKLYISDTKLREAISQNGNAVMELFTRTSASTDSATKFSESGLAERLHNNLNSVMTKLTDKAGSSASLADNSTIGKGLSRINTDISKWGSRLEDIEQRYWKKFTAMETAMSRANSQSSWLSQQQG